MSQNNKEVNKQLFYFNQKLDSISQSLYLKDEIIKLQQAEIDKLTGLYNNVFNEYQVLEKGAQEQSKHIENQEWFLGVFMAVLIVAFFSIIALIVNIIERKKLNKDLESKKKVIAEKNNELVLKNNEITDSIRYARRIQNAIMPSNQELSVIYKDSFVYFKPKDIVSGDFYWAARHENKLFFVTADCTGHGVPGALMSMLGASFINEIINERKIYKTSLILDELRIKIVNLLNRDQDLSNIKDGIDLSLICVDFSKYILSYSAANNGVYIIRDKQLMKLLPDKQPIGVVLGEYKKFSYHEIELLKDDIIITFTDGYADQFGGKSGKKLKYKQMQEFLIECSSQPINKFPQLLDIFFNKWKGKNEQVDDVLIAGLKI